MWLPFVHRTWQKFHHFIDDVTICYHVFSMVFPWFFCMKTLICSDFGKLLPRWMTTEGPIGESGRENDRLKCSATWKPGQKTLNSISTISTPKYNIVNDVHMAIPMFTMPFVLVLGHPGAPRLTFTINYS